jgi:two-component sensor histidine kinase
MSYIEINDRFYDYHNFPDSSREKIDFSHVNPFSNYPEDLALSYDQNHLSFHFSAIDWAAPEKIKYSYRMIGLDERWSSPSPDAIAEYRNLQHGKYQLQVKAIGQLQVWSAPVSYSFTIRPPWWLAWWFKSIIVFVSLALLFFIIRFIYLFQLRKQKALLEKRLAVQYERQRISAEMHDDIGAGLSGIKLMTEMAKKKSKDEDSVSEMDKIYQSVGDVSAKMKEVIWSLNTENDSLSSLVSYLQKQARMTMENYPGKFTITLPDKIPDIQINGEARRHIYLIVKEALHNIIKHSGADKVEVVISCDDKLRIIVSDNGKGMSTDENSSGGNGMKNMRQRMQQLGGAFFIKDKEGLTLTFEIPLKPAL